MVTVRDEREEAEIMKYVGVHDVNMGKGRVRKSFATIDEVVEMPDLIEVQKNSYERFLKEDLREVLNDVSPIYDFNGNLKLEFVDYALDKTPKYSLEECRERDMTYATALKVLVRLTNNETGEVKESEVFMGDFPLMTEHGTFIINGGERVIVSQLVRSPGVYYRESIDKAGKHLFDTQVIPSRGAWLEYEIDSNDVIWVRVDRARKLPVTSLLRALGYGSDEQIRQLLGNDEKLEATMQRDGGDDGTRRYSSRSDVALLITRYNYFANTLDGGGADALEAALRDTGDHNDALLDEIRAIRAKKPSNIVALIDAVAQTKLPPEQRRNEYAYIAALQDQALRMADTSDSSLASFLDAYERNINVWAIQAASDIDAVEAMTIHRSKGLGRDCVIIPFGDWELEHGNTRMWLPLDAFGPLQGKDCVPPALYVDVPNTSPLADAEQSPVAPLVEAEIKAERIDNLNATYVAYTRAKHELIVYTGCRGVGADIARCLQSDTVPAPGTISLAGQYDADTATFTLGAPTKATAAKASVPNIDAGVYNVIFRDDTRELVCIDDLLAADTDIGNEQPAEVVDPRPAFASTPEMDEAARRGTVLHSVLANTLVIDDLEEALRWNAARENIGDAELETFRRDLAGAFAAGGEEVESWFAPGNEVLVERTIYAPSGSPGEPDRSLRPDRVVIAPDGTVTVVDYKFTTEVKNSHRRQVSEYISLMHSLGYERVGGRLWYPLLHKVIRVE